MNTLSMKPRTALLTTTRMAALVVLASLISPQTHASIVGPYSTSGNANTLYFFPLTEPAGTVVATNWGAQGGYAYACTNNTAGTLTNPPAMSGYLGGPGFAPPFGLTPSFGNCWSNTSVFLTNAFVGYDYANLGWFYDAGSTATNTPDFLLMTNLNIGNGGQSPFTIEAMICPYAANANVILDTDSHIASGPYNGHRGVLLQLGLNGANNAIEFYPIGYTGAGAPGNGPNVWANIPASGPNALVPGAWYHVAVTFDGANVKVYWTAMNPTNRYDNLLTNVVAAATNIDAAFGTNVIGPLIIGNGDYYGDSRQGFDGSIAQVRISSVCLSSNQMMFGQTNGVWITNQPQNTVALPGSAPAFSVGAFSDYAPVVYQWFTNAPGGGNGPIHNGPDSSGAIFYGATNSSLIISNVSAAYERWTYSCSMTNSRPAPGPDFTNTVSATLTIRAAKNLAWRGAAPGDPGNWDNTANTNWFDTVGLTNAPFTQLDDVTFDDSGTANPVNIPVVVQPGSVTVSANNTNYTFSGVGSINNPAFGALASFTKNNNSTVTIQTTNGYSGVTTLNGGIVSVGQLANGGSPCGIGSASNSSTNLVFNGGELQYTGPSVTINRGATLNAGGGTLAVSTAGGILADSGVIAGAGGLTVVPGGGVLALSGANTYSGGTLISSGAAVALAGGGTPLGSGNVTDNGALVVSTSIGMTNNLSGSGILTNAAGATFMPSGNNSSFNGSFYVGTTNLAASTLQVSNSTTLGANSTVTLAGLNASALEFVNASGNQSASTISIPASVSLTAIAGEHNGFNTREELQSGAETYGIWNGSIRIEGDGTSGGGILYLNTSGASTGPLTINGNVSGDLSGPTLFAGQLDPEGTGDYGVLNGTISLGPLAQFIVQGGTWTLNSSGNTWGISWSELGTLKLGVANALPATVPLVLGASADLGILDLNGNNQTVAGLYNDSTGTGAAIITNSSPVYATFTYSNSLDNYFMVGPAYTNGVVDNNFTNTGAPYSGSPYNNFFYTNFPGSTPGTIAGKLGLTVAAGILNLNGTNTYFGATTLSNGTILALTGNGSISNSTEIVIGPNATFSQSSSVGAANNPFTLGSAQTLIGVGPTGTLAGNMNMNAGSSLELNYNGVTPTLVVTNGTFTCNAGGVVTVNVPNSLPVGSSYSYLLVSNGPNGTVGGTVPSSVVINGLTDVAGTLAINGAGLVLTVTNYVPKNLEWRGTVSTNWDTVTTNWYDMDLTALDFTNFNTLDDVTFDDNVGVSNNLVNISGLIQPGIITVSANNTNYTFNGVGAIVGAGGLTMSGNSTLTILTTNNYTGMTTINAGIVSVNNLAIGGAASAIGAAGSESGNLVLNGGQLQYTGPGVAIDRGATLGANGGSVAVTTPGSVLTTSGTIAGSNGGGLTVAAGSGIFALSGINSYNGGTTISAGGTGGLAGGTFGSGSVTNNGTLWFSGSDSVGNTITGPGILTNSPGATLSLSGTNTFTGNVYVGTTNQNGADLNVLNSASLTTNNIQLNILGGVGSGTLGIAGGVTIPTNVTLVIQPVNGASDRVGIQPIPGGSGNCTINGNIYDYGDGGGNNFVGFYGASGEPLVINGNIIAEPSSTNEQVDARGGVGYQIIFNGTVGLGGAVLFAPNDGSFCTINSTGNTWGICDIANGEIILGTNNALDVNVPVESGGTSTAILNMNGYSQIFAGLKASASSMLITNTSATYSTLIYSNTVGYYTNVAWDSGFWGTFTNYIGSIAGNISLNVNAGILNLGGANTYTGATFINTNAQLWLTGSGAIGASTNIIISTNAIFATSGQTLNPVQTLTGVGPTGTIAGNFTVGAGSSLVLNYSAGLPVLQVTNGTLTLSGNASATINVPGTLTQGTYLLISTNTGGLVSGAPPISVAVNGIAPGTFGASLAISGGQLYLILSQSPLILDQYPVPYINPFTLYKGASPTFSVVAGAGVPPFTYQWFTNGVPDGPATASSLQLTNVQSSFANNYCVVANIFGSVTSAVWSATVIADPLNAHGAPVAYPSNVLTLNPIGYWRMNETDDGLSDGNPGLITHDYAGGNDGIYTNVILSQPGYNPYADPSDTSASFGTYPSYPSPVNCYAGSVQGIDVSATNGANGEFTVEAWVNATNQLDATNGIVTKGYLGQEEFSLDAGGPGNAFRFAVRNAAGAVYNANSTLSSYVNGSWYYLAGVCDEASGNIYLYTNGTLAATVGIPPNSGILNSSLTPLTIGSRALSATSGVTNQFYGNINDVAVFNQALSAGQIASQYQLAGPFAPSIVAQLPQTYTNLFTLYAGVNLSFSVSVSGTPPLTYQWFTNGVLDTADITNVLPMTNVQAGVFSNYCIVSDVAGSATSMVWSAQVISAPAAPYPTNVLVLNPIGYWRLNDVNLDGADNGGGDNGYICNDYAGGNNGVYTNVILDQSGYNPTTDPSDTSVYFGADPDGNSSDFGDEDVNSIAGINFGSPAGTSVAFTVEAWVNGYAQDSDAGLVTLGWGGGGEQFNLDTGGSDPAHDFRFFIRDASGAVHAVNSTNGPLFGTWHHLVGVVDEISSQDVAFYIDGQLVGTSPLASGSGILSSTYQMSIGARQGSQTSSYNYQFVGDMNDVAIFNYALSPVQVENEYVAGGGTNAPYFNPQPSANSSAAANSTLTIPVTALGSPPLSYSWTNLTTGAGIASGTTNAAAGDVALSYPNVPLSWNGDQLQLTVTNAWGTTSALITLTIANGINTNPTNIVFGVTNKQLYLTWPADHTGWQLQAQTNKLSVGIGTNWVNVTGSAGTNQVVVPINLTNGSVFYRLVY